VQAVNSLELQHYKIQTVQLTDYEKVFEKLQKFIESQLNSQQKTNNMLFLFEEQKQAVSKPTHSYEIHIEEVYVKPESSTKGIENVIKSIVDLFAEDFGYAKKQAKKLDYSVHADFVRIGYTFYPIKRQFGVKYITYNGNNYEVGTTINNERVVLK
jgi:hypothetical protein